MPSHDGFRRSLTLRFFLNGRSFCLDTACAHDILGLMKSAALSVIMFLLIACAGHHELDVGADAGAIDADETDAAAADTRLPVPFACDALANDELVSLAYASLVPDSPQPAEVAWTWPETGIRYWSRRCAHSAAENVEFAVAQIGPMASLLEMNDDALFYEAQLTSGSNPYTYRSTRCDFYDGMVLAGAPHHDELAIERLAAFESFMRVSSAGLFELNYDSEVIARHHATCDGDGCVNVVCLLRLLTQDGNCDRLTLLSREDSVRVDGRASIGAPANVREFDGPRATGWMLGATCDPN